MRLSCGPFLTLDWACVSLMSAKNRSQETIRQGGSGAKAESWGNIKTPGEHAGPCMREESGTVLLLTRLPGVRKTEIQDAVALKQIEEQVAEYLKVKSIHLETLHSSSEEELIEWLNEHRGAGFLLLNPGELAHNGIELRDAVKSLGIPYLEIHPACVQHQEAFRYHSIFSDGAVGVLAGLRLRGYLLGAEFAADYLKQPSVQFRATPNLH